MNYPFLTQKERDIETGLDYFTHRYYSSIQGRFTSADQPFADQYEGDPQSWNLYAYVKNNPLKYTDPFGLWHWVDPDKNGNRFIQWDEGDDWHTLSTFLYNETGRDYLPGDLAKAYSSGGLGADTILDFTGAPSRFFTNNRGGVQDTSWDFYLTILPAAQGAKAVGGVIRGAWRGLAGLFARRAATAAANEFVGISAEEIAAISRQLGATTTLTGEVDTIVANMSYRTTFWEKVATAVRDIAGRHMFDDANKRTAQKVVEELMRRNGVSGPSSGQIRAVIDRVARGELRDPEGIAQALSGGH